MADDKKQISETGQAVQAKTDVTDDVGQKSHGGATRPAPPVLSPRKPLFRR